MLTFLVEFDTHAFDFGIEIRDPLFEFRDGQRRQAFADHNTARLLCRHQVIKVHWRTSMLSFIPV